MSDSEVDQVTGSTFLAIEPRAQERAAHFSGNFDAGKAEARMPASERKESRAAVAGTAIFASLHSLTKVLAGGMKRFDGELNAYGINPR